MFTRILSKPTESIFLLGPRGTGKSTWIKQNINKINYYDLLDTSEALKLSKNPGLLYKELQHLEEGAWVIIDEIQKVPALLDEVHRLMEDRRLKFLLSGSSARKLKKGGANLLAGRARLEYMFPLVSAEIDFNLKFPDRLQWGMLPMSITSDDPKPYLKTYVETYLQEEIKGEALARNIGGFGRFLEIAARQNGQITNVSGIARDALVARPTVQGYFDILVDTLIGFWFYPWKLKRATKQIAHPKFYFFDAGVARALSGRLPYPPTQEELDPLFETFIAGEIKAYLSYQKLDYPLYFWSSHDGVEVDFFCETQKGHVAIECKMGETWQKKYNKGLERIRQEMSSPKLTLIGVYMGERELTFDSVRVLPVLQFLKALWKGEIIG